ncbi:D-amino-acid oxidase [Roridomyces roridus]|uniref:D-amino-acid oxidase n=1 Tax=Roridomyces roridus TaxID=1738132 RepID=A0AAD7C2A1_9AGAR|nr:D-amino-acid oxidase [Roridomyces roridus]
MLEPKQIVVIGAGVVGLTTALLVQEKLRDYQVVIVAEILPSDPKTIKYTSHWAGAHHVSLAGPDLRQQKMDQDTFKTMWDLSAPGGPAEGCFLRIREDEFFAEPIANPEVLRVMPDYQSIPASDLPPDVAEGISFTTLTIDSPVYLNYLLSRFLAAGGSIVRGTVQHIAQVVEGGAGIFSGRKCLSSPSAVMVCVGLGARTLGGVEDKEVYPIRGQTVLLRAPWVRFGRACSSKNGLWTYIIPRRSGDVIVGGIKEDNDWYPLARAETTRDILNRALALCPELAPPDIRTEREPSVEDLQPIIIEDGCGLRPGRKGGIRLEVEQKAFKVPVVFNYGHGGYGYQSSWGSATMALELLEKSLAEAKVIRYRLDYHSKPKLL